MLLIFYLTPSLADPPTPPPCILSFDRVELGNRGNQNGA